MPLAWWDHALTFRGTGLRFGELAGLRCRRIHLDRPVPVLQVVEVRYQAGGQFGSGFRGRPKSDAGIRELPLAPLVVESIRRQLPPDGDPDLLVFTGPGGGNGVPVGAPTMLSRYNFRRVYQRAVARAGHDLVGIDPHGPHDLRHPTPEMALRVTTAIQERLAVVVQVAEAILQLDGSDGRVF